MNEPLDSKHARLVPGPLPKIVVAHPRCAGEVYLHGAHVTSFKPTGAANVLFLSPKSEFDLSKAIRGGVPICFPWFGPREGLPAHGFARTTAWTLAHVFDEPDGVTLRLVLESSDATKKLWPHAFRAEYDVTFGSTLRLVFSVTNHDNQPLEYEEALHTYLAVSLIDRTSVGGLAGIDYLDKPAGQARRTQGGDRIVFTEEVDRVYLDTQAACDVTDGRRTLRVNKTGSNCTVIWNPGPARASKMADLGAEAASGFVCVETANCAGYPVRLVPGETHTTTATIEII